MRLISRFLHLLRRGGIYIAAVLILLGSWYYARRWARPNFPPQKAWEEQASRVRILRDEWGIPHVFGKSDADTAFGLAYAHAEDDFPLIQGGMIAARGQLSVLLLGKTAIINDYYVRLFRIREETAERYEAVDPAMRRVLQAYADGLNYYAALHPDEADTRFFPVTGADVLGGFIHKLPLFVGLDKAMGAVSENNFAIGDKLDRPAIPDSEDKPTALAYSLVGSNTQAVSRNKSTDGITRLNVNSHQPWEGPVAWYEAHLVSEEGWNMTGGTFPGAPFILHGHNDHLGWAHTVNHPDLLDVYKLEMHPDGSLKYKWDGEWKDMEVTEASIPIDTGFFFFRFKREILRAMPGPVLRTPFGFYAFRVAGFERLYRGPEQWYRMNKARNLAEWKDAMRVQGLPLFNTVYADKTNILYVYNGNLPMRDPSFSWRTVLPGNTSRALWHDYLPFDKLPMVENPPSGFVQNCNSTPFQATIGPGNPDPARYAKAFGIDTRQTNRAVRSLELFGKPGKLSRDDFLLYKWDRQYVKGTPIYRHAIDPVLRSFHPENDDEKKALEMLRNYDGSAEEWSTTAALAILTYREIWAEADLEKLGTYSDPLVKFREAVRYLKKNYGRIDVPLGEVQRLRRGSVDLPVGGGPDVMSAVHAEEKDGHLIGAAGDSYVLFVEFAPEGTQSWSIHQYGNVNRPGSRHYADQAELFVHRNLKKALRTEREIRQRLEAEYHPGREKTGAKNK